MQQYLILNKRFCAFLPYAFLLSLALLLPLSTRAASGSPQRPTLRELRQNKARNVAARVRSERLLRRLRVLGQRTPLMRIRIMAPLQKPGRRASVPIKRGAPLDFKFDGFTPAQTTDFENFVRDAYPLMVQVYGEPAPAQQGKSVRVVFDATAGDGIYELPPEGSATEGGRIFYEPLTPGSGVPEEQARDINNYNLARQMLISFHGRLVFDYDAWELGFSDAAALVVAFRVQGSPATFDPSLLGVYLMPVYDLFNRPELGNTFFFSEGSSSNLGFFRAGMAQSAWLKAYIENPNFFRLFNAQYYQRVASTTGVPLPGNTPALKQIAAGITPTVEGLRFPDWYRRQHVLDTAVTVGEKLWFAVIPLSNLTAGDTRSVFIGVAQYYRTLANGDEEILNGTGTVTAFDENGNNVTNRSAEIGSDNRLVFEEGEAELEAGFRDTGTPDVGRIALLLQLNAAEAVAPFPYNVAGTEDQPSGFYGVVLGSNAGQVAIKAVNLSPTAALVRGAFGTEAVYPSGPSVKTEFTLSSTTGAAPGVLRRNSAWSIFQGKAQSLAVLLETAPGNATFDLNVQRGGGLRMISLPFFPVQSDEAAVLGISQNELLMARYRPNLSPSSFTQNGIQFGITADKHELYPNISEPFAPGRGYWLKLQDDLATTVRGGEPPRTGAGSRPYEVPLIGGWNQIGVPYNQPFTLSAVRVRFGDESPVPFATAVSNGWVAPGIWRWRPEGGYARVDTGSAANQTLQPFEGYYIFTSEPRGVKMVFDASAQAMAAVSKPDDSLLFAVPKSLIPIPQQTVPEWQLSLAVATASAQDVDNSFGVTNLVDGKLRLMPAAKPPAAERALTLNFLSGGSEASDQTGAGEASGWADSFVAPMPVNAVWQFIVDGAVPGTSVRLAWGDPASVPRGLNLILVDELTRQRVSMNSLNSTRTYSYTAGVGARRFRIEARAMPSAVSDLQVVPWASSAFALVIADFVSSGSAKVEILDGTGQVVRILANRQPVWTGRSYWMWNLRDNWGRKVPRGTYTARVSFLDRDGVTHQRDRSFTF